MLEVKKISKLSLANIAALLYALFGFIVSFTALIYTLIKVILEKETAGKLAQYIFINLGLDFLIALGVAVIAGIIGWLVGLIAAAFYNFLAREIGGIKIEFLDETSVAPVTKAESTLKDKQELFKY
jgi:hypothetical protein